MTHVLITGAGGLLGTALANEFSTHAEHLSLQFRNRQPEISHINPATNVHLLQQDFGAGDIDEIAADLISAAEAEAGEKIEIAVLNAADQSVKAWTELAAQDWDSMYENTFRSTAVLLQALGQQLAESTATNKVIIVIGSIEGIKPNRNHAPYAIMKAALHHLVTAAAFELGAQGVRVVGVAPGLIARAGIESDWPTGVEHWEKASALGRMVTAEEVAQVVSFLASSKASAITGVTIPVDAGWNSNPGW